MKRALIAAMIASSAVLSAGVPRQATPRTVFASVTDKAGRPVLDMQAADFEVKDNGRRQEISARLAPQPLRVALIVSDRGSGAFQGGALRFCEALLGHGEVSIIALIVQPETLVDYTTSPDALRGGLQQLGRRGVSKQSGAQLIETILDASRTAPRAGTRPALVVMTAGGEAGSSVRVDRVREAFRESGAVMYVVSTAPPGGDARTYYTGDEAANLNRFQGNNAGRDDPSVLRTVLEAGSRESGGRFIPLAGTTTVPTMQQVAAELINQYEITYTLAAGTTPSDRVEVSAKRRDVTVRAPSRIAN